MSASTLRTPAALAAAGLVDAARASTLEEVAARYAVAVTPALAELIDDPCGPIGRQFLPDPAELETTAAERADPIGDADFSPVPGVVHRYPDRALLKLTGTCAVYCRFCFRREEVGRKGGGALSPPALDRALAYFAEHPAIWEVIVTGGDPFVLSARRIADLMRRLAAIPHVHIVRFHTRVPIADPARITPALVRALKSPSQTVWVALHANHAGELTPAARAACARLVDAGIPMVSQTVLLKHVNDDAAALEALLRALVETRVKPYYLHHLDPAPGVSRFATGLAAGQALMRSLRGAVSGLCQPTYVLDIPGGAGKVPIGPCYLSQSDSGVTVEDPFGRAHPWPGA
jgi:lysine 2,3-aminomutase